MRDLNWDLLQLQRRDPDGSHATRRDRSYALARMADALHEAGYRGLRAKGLKGKHVEALVRHWRTVSTGVKLPKSAEVKIPTWGCRQRPHGGAGGDAAIGVGWPLVRRQGRWGWSF